MIKAIHLQVRHAPYCQGFAILAPCGWTQIIWMASSGAVLAVVGIAALLLWLFLVLHHEVSTADLEGRQGKLFQTFLRTTSTTKPVLPKIIIPDQEERIISQPKPIKDQPIEETEEDDEKDLISSSGAENGHNAGEESPIIDRRGSRRGLLVCNGVPLDSEVIYWKIVPGDNEFESPISPHHGLHHDRYLSFEYDQGGWNNVRMGMESLIVVAHAMGRTLVVPPQQHLYLLGERP